MQQWGTTAVLVKGLIGIPAYFRPSFSLFLWSPVGPKLYSSSPLAHSTIVDCRGFPPAEDRMTRSGLMARLSTAACGSTSTHSSWYVYVLFIKGFCGWRFRRWSIAIPRPSNNQCKGWRKRIYVYLVYSYEVPLRDVPGVEEWGKNELKTMQHVIFVIIVSYAYTTHISTVPGMKYVHITHYIHTYRRIQQKTLFENCTCIFGNEICREIVWKCYYLTESLLQIFLKIPPDIV